MSSNSYWEILENLTDGYCLARCCCGEVKKVRKYNIIHGLSLSCGCRSRSTLVRSGIPIEYSKRLIRIFLAMKQRCYNKKHDSFKDYGGKGITVCSEWIDNSLEFYSWAVTNGYNNELSIDRIDSTKGYYPENCRWVTPSENTTNMLIDNFSKSIGQFSEESIAKLTDVNRNNLGRCLTLVDKDGVQFNFRCLLEAAEYIVTEKGLSTEPKQIKKNLSACIHGKRKSCHGYIVIPNQII